MRIGSRSLRWPRRSAAGAGRDGERLAAFLYRAHGYRILGRDVRLRVAQVDLVVRRGDALVLVEVKRRRGPGSAMQALGPEQAQRLARAATVLGRRHPWARSVRVDLVAIDRWRVRIARGVFDASVLEQRFVRERW